MSDASLEAKLAIAAHPRLIPATACQSLVDLFIFYAESAAHEKDLGLIAAQCSAVRLAGRAGALRGHGTFLSVHGHAVSVNAPDRHGRRGKRDRCRSVW